MMSRAKLVGVLLVVLAAGAIGVTVFRAELFGATIVNSKTTVVAPSKDWLEQHIRAADRAANRSAIQGMRDDCAALEKLGATDPACTQFNSRH